MSTSMEPTPRAEEFHARLDRGVLRFLIAPVLVGLYGAGWYFAVTELGWSNRAFGGALPVILAVGGLVLSFRRELHVGPYGVVVATWPLPIDEVRIARPDVLVVAVAKRAGRRRDQWDVVAQIRGEGYRKLTRPFLDHESAERAAAAIRAALDILRTQT
jgi:hypothetical protein